MLKHSILALALCAAASTVANAAAITWGATIDNGFSTFEGTELPIGNLARLGTFDITDAVIQANSGNLAFLNSHFTLIDSARIGDGIGANSNFAVGSNRDTTNVVGLQVYYWVFLSSDNSTLASSFNTAFEDGIFYVDKAVNNQWAFPPQSPVPGSITNDISDLTNSAGTALIASGAHIVIGSFPKGASTAGGAPNFGLAPTPEPSSIVLLGAGALGLLARRRRQS